MRPRTPALLLSSALFAACDYEAPLDPGAEALLNRVGGEVVFGGGPEVGTTYVTVFDAANPPPPAGLGAPVTFAAVAEEAFTGGDATLRSAPFAITHLEDGEYVFGALSDLDGDFQPFPTALAGATCGDWGGAHLASLATTDFGPIRVQGGQSVDDVTILVGSEYTTERPAFGVTSSDPIPFTDLVAAFPKSIRLKATSVGASFAEDLELHLGPSCPQADLPYCDGLSYCPCDTEAMPPCATAQWVWMMDADADGVVDPYPAEAQADAGVLDVWPRVYLESAAELETWVDADGVERQERWVAEAYPLLFELMIAALGGGTPADVGPVGVPFPVEQLNVTLSTTFAHYHEGGALKDPVNGPYDLVDLTVGGMDQVPAGDWSVTVVSFTGQTWTVPNETGALESLDPTFDPRTQARGLVFTR